MLKLKLQYFGHLMGRTDSLEKTLMLGKVESRRKRGQQGMRWLDGIKTWWTWVWASSSLWWWTGKPGVLQSMGSQRVIHDWVTELNWIELNWTDRHLKCVCVCVVVLKVQSWRTEPLTYGIWCHLQVESVRIELNCRVSNSCLRSAWWHEKLHPTSPNWEFGTKLFHYIYMSK